jgi:hypothetical protein
LGSGEGGGAVTAATVKEALESKREWIEAMIGLAERASAPEKGHVAMHYATLNATCSKVS